MAINFVLDRLEKDPWIRSVGSTTFKTERYRNVAAADARYDDWYVLWEPGSEKTSIEIVAIAQLRR